jgi:hypothetical protein
MCYVTLGFKDGSTQDWDIAVACRIIGFEEMLQARKEGGVSLRNDAAAVARDSHAL